MNKSNQPLMVLLKEMTEQQVIHIQVLLRRAGFFPVELNGKPDAYTHVALNSFKESVNLSNDNYVGPSTVFALERVTRQSLTKATPESLRNDTHAGMVIPFDSKVFPELLSFKNTCKLEETYPSLCEEIQVILKETGFYKGSIDGSILPEFKEAFINWGKTLELERPGYIGPTTIANLLDTAQRPRPFNIDSPRNPKDLYKTIYLPTGDRVYVNASIIFNGNFTWGELTDDGYRVPQTREVVKNIIALAQRLEDVRQVLGNRPITILSGYRTDKANSELHGTLSSQHKLGKAVDITYGGNMDKAYRILNERWNGALGDGRERGMLHLDTRPYRIRFGYVKYKPSKFPFMDE